MHSSKTSCDDISLAYLFHDYGGYSASCTFRSLHLVLSRSCFPNIGTLNQGWLVEEEKEINSSAVRKSLS